MSLAEGIKYDGGKLRYDLIPISALQEVAKVFTYGASKYEDRNWEKGISYGRVYGAAMRHLTEWWDRKDLDPETGINHLGHAAANIFFLLHYAKYKQEYDNRPEYETVST